MPNTFLKSSFRQPIRVLILFLLFGSISFVFVSRTAEYLIVQGETERLGGYFRSIGTIQPLNPEDYEVDISEAVALIEQSAFVDFGDRHNYSSGILPGIYNADVDGAMADISSFWRGFPITFGIHNSDVFFYGELIEKSEEPVYRIYPSDVLAGYPLFFIVDTVVAGYPEYIRENKIVRVIVSPDFDIFASMEIGQRYFIRAWYEPKSIVWNWKRASQNLQLKPLTEEEGPNYLILPFDKLLAYSSPEFETLRKEIELVQENQHAMFVFATTDMSALPLMQESSRWYYLTEGRWINHEDHLMASKVCAVRSEFADMRKIKVGDTISLTLRSLQERGEYIMNGPDRESWQSYPTAELNCEIVGLYSQQRHQITEEFNTIYIPSSIFNLSLQVSENTTPSYSYNFVLKSSRDEETFLLENQQALTNLGLDLVFVENKGGDFWNAVDPIRRSSLVSALIFGGVLIISLLLAVFLYLRQRKRDFAILRALGVPKRTAILQNMLPISLIGFLGIFLGGSISWRYSLNNAAETLSELPLPSGELPSVTLDLLWLVGLCFGIIALLLLCTWVGTLLVAHQPVLVLLQGNIKGIQKGKKRKGGAATEASAQTERKNGGISAIKSREFPAKTLPPNRKIINLKSNFNSLIRYQFRQFFRSGLRSLLTVLVASGFVLALGWMQWTMERNTIDIDRLYDNIIVDAQILKKNPSLITISDYGFINRRIVDAILETGFVQSSYLVANSEKTNVGHMDIETREIIPFEEIDGLSLLAFDQPERFFSHSEDFLITNDSITSLEYAPGWDESLFADLWTEEMVDKDSVPVIITTSLFQLLELKYEDIVFITDRFRTTRFQVIGQYTGGSRFSVETVMIPLSALEVMDGRFLGYSVVEFELDPSRNRELPIFRQEVEEMIEEPVFGQVPLRVVFWDEELRAVVAPMEKNLALMAILYPGTIILSVLIAVGFSFFLVMQNAKDAAILRVLGTTKTKVRALFSGEQALLSLIGLLLGLMILAILRRDLTVAHSGPALLSAGLYFAGAILGSLIGAILVTRRKPLELLQVKE